MTKLVFSKKYITPFYKNILWFKVMPNENEEVAVA